MINVKSDKNDILATSKYVFTAKFIYLPVYPFIELPICLFAYMRRFLLYLLFILLMTFHRYLHKQNALFTSGGFK
jgi:hypothetical protein